MTALKKVKSHPDVVDYFKELQFYIKHTLKKYQSGNHTNNQQKCIDCFKPRSNKNELECKKCGCNHFYVPGHEQQFLCLEIDWV